MSGINISDFVENELIPQLRRMVGHGAGYLAYGQIAIGVELFGACKDSHDFDQQGHSKCRFERGITDYMAKVDQRYAAYNNSASPYYLYKNLRCGMAHLIRPQGGTLAFIGAGPAATKGWRHLDVPAGQNFVVFAIETFLEDFEKAWPFLKSELPNLIHPKLSPPFLAVATV